MTSMMFLLYLVGQADSISSLFVTFAVLFTGISAVLVIVRFCCDGDDDGQHAADLAKRLFKFALPVAIVSCLLGGFFPNSNTMRGIAAGEIVMEAVNTPEVQSIAGNSVKLLDNYLKDLVEKKQQKN